MNLWRCPLLGNVSCCFLGMLPLPHLPVTPSFFSPTLLSSTLPCTLWPFQQTWRHPVTSDCGQAQCHLNLGTCYGMKYGETKSKWDKAEQIKGCYGNLRQRLISLTKCRRTRTDSSGGGGVVIKVIATLCPRLENMRREEEEMRSTGLL
jgi:hypothetical protein